MFYRICWLLTYLPFLIIFPTKIIGKKNLKKKGRMIFCCNHQSNNDVIIIASKIVRRFNFMAKDELFQNKFQGAILKSFGGYPVKRGANDITSVKHTLKILKQEKALCMFPEGTRVAEGDSSSLKTGAILFSLKTNSPIIPSVFLNKPRAFRKTILVIGEPILLYDMPEFINQKISKELLDAGSKILVNAMLKLKEQNTITVKPIIDNKK